MILDTILFVIANSLIALFSVLPNKEIMPTIFDTAFSWFTDFFAGVIYALNGANDVGTSLGVILVLYITLEVGLFVWEGVKTIANFVRGSGA